MIFIYFAFLFLTGLMASILVVGHDRKYFPLHLALMPLFSGALPVAIIFLLNTLHLKIDATNLLCPWILLFLLGLFFTKKTMKTLLLQLKQRWQQWGFKSKILVVLLLLADLQLALTYTVMPLRIGDGKAQWGWKAAEWVKLEEIKFTEEHKKSVLFPIVKQYPLFHSAEMMVNIISTPFLPAHSAKIYDFIYFGGIILVFCAIFLHWQYPPHIALFLAHLGAYAQRQQVLYLSAGYAEINLNYLGLLLFLLLLYFNLKDQNHSEKRLCILMGIVTGIMSITKNEGTHRWLIILLLFTFIYQIPWRKWKYLFIALPLWISLKYFHWINMPDTSSYNEYLDHIVLNWDHFRFQAPIIAQALLHSFKYEGLFKSHWLVMLFFALFSLRDVQQNQNKNLRQAFSFCLILFFVNCLYNSLPMLITKPPGTYSIEIISIADNLISRLNCQSASFLALACLIAIITFYRKIGVKPLPSGMGI